ncbi:transposase [Sinorhizobium psoraleae]|uniref:transposase n=1 Tax=Sinorhizobium psoraleae TaxID=520838 RepID=UPI0035E3DACD
MEKGAEKQAIRRSLGGRSTKIHAVCDSLGRAIGVRSDARPARRCNVAVPLLTALPLHSCAADTAYDADGLRKFLLARGSIRLFPTSYAQTRPSFDRSAYKRRNLIERMFCRLKDWRRITTRCDKLARNSWPRLHQSFGVSH